jgi:hypothetical protein
MNTTPLDEHAWHFLDPESARVVREALKAVIEHPDTYDNGFFIEREKRGAGFIFFLANGNRVGPFINNQGIPVDVTNPLIHHGIAGPKVNPQWPDRFRSFTEDALEWQRTYGAFTPDEIRTRLGRTLKRQLDSTQGRFIEFNPEALATTIGTSPERISEQFRILCDLGLLQTRHIGDGKTGFLGLSSPSGLLWAEHGYPPIKSLNNQTINVTVDLHLEIRTIIEQARTTDLPEERIREFEALLRRAEEELEKPTGKGQFQRIRELMEFAANAKELAPLAGRLVADHGDKIQQLIDLGT